MEYTLREVIDLNGRTLPETDYFHTPREALNFRLLSGDHFKWEGGKLRFKNCVTVMDYEQIVEAFPPFGNVRYKSRDIFPYFAGDIDILYRAWKDGKKIAVEGGPCLFGQYELVMTVHMKDGQSHMFDYANGKAYLKGDDGMAMGGMAFSTEEGVVGFLCGHGKQVEHISFSRKKTALTSQEYMNLRYPFETAAALGGPLVIPIPDMSYRKYLIAVLHYLPEEIREQMMSEYDAIVKKIVDYYLAAIDKLQEEFQIKEFKCVHGGSRDEIEAWYSKRAAYIERKKVLRSLTSVPGKIEPIKDYISMPALPYYLFGSDLILQMDSVDETDSYRKCRKAHKKAFQMGCIMIPELLSEDNIHTVYNAPIAHKKYGDYDQLTKNYLGI